MLRHIDSRQAGPGRWCAGVHGLDHEALGARGGRRGLATAGGCLASPYLAAWVIARKEGTEAAASALHYVAPVGEKEPYVSNAMKNITPYLPAQA